VVTKGIVDHPIAQISHQVHIVNELIHLLEPCVGILIRKVITHCPHEMVCPKLLALCHHHSMQNSPYYLAEAEMGIKWEDPKP
jgi:hypothetical protein